MGSVYELAKEPFLLLHHEHGTGCRRSWNCCHWPTRFVVIWKDFCLILFTGTRIRLHSVMCLRSSSRGHITSASVTVTVNKLTGMKIQETMLHYLLEEIPWPDRDLMCPESSSTSWRPTDGRLLPAHPSRHAREPPDGYNHEYFTTTYENWNHYITDSYRKQTFGKMDKKLISRWDSERELFTTTSYTYYKIKKRRKNKQLSSR